MIQFSNAPSGRHFLQIRGPTNVPDRILRAIDHPTIDHRGPEFGALCRRVLSEVKTVFKTSHDVVVHTGSGAQEAALVNTLSAGDRVLMFETGHFASLWHELAERLGLQVDFVAGGWRHVLQRRIERAKDLLRATDMPVADIAFAVGFSSQSHISNWFQRVVGISPAAYRKRC